MEVACLSANYIDPKEKGVIVSSSDSSSSGCSSGVTHCDYQNAIIDKLILYEDITALTENSPWETWYLNHVQTWVASNKVDLYYTKSKFVIFKRRSCIEVLSLMAESSPFVRVISIWEFISTNTAF